MRVLLFERGVVAVLAARFRTASRLLQVVAVMLMLAIVWYAVNLTGPVGPEVLLWIPSIVTAVAIAVAFAGAARARQLPAAARRFWRHLSIAAVPIAMGCVAQAVEVLRHPDATGPPVGPPVLACYGIAILVVIVALYRLPLRHQEPGEALRVGLDAGTAMLASAVFVWHFRPRSVDWAGNTVLSVAFLVVTALVSVAVLAVAKVVISSYAAVDKVALRLLALAMGTAAVGPQLIDMLIVRPHLSGVQLMNPVTFLLSVLAGDRQRMMTYGPRRGASQERRRPFSVLPYVAVAAVDALLLWVAFTPDGHDEQMIVVAAVGLTALVVLRQFTAFRDNSRLLAQLDHAATHDALTQLPNRALFAQRLQKALTAPAARPVCVALIDLDDFKEVNDTLGHEVGDLLLVAVAQRLAGCVRGEDTVARLGGDEFVVVLDGADRDAADLAAQRMITALQPPVVADGHELLIRASIGMADGRGGDEPSALLRYADIAMYAAKNVTGTASLHYEEAMAATVTDSAHLGVELRRAIVEGQLSLVYQPIVSLRDGRVVGAEALVRWAHPTRGLLAPDAFIPVAERTGLILELSRWVLRSACRQLATWIAMHGDAAPAALNVNISARDLREPAFATEVATLLDEFAVAPDRLVLEVTETMVVEPGDSVTNLERLRALGVRVSLDDFGTGHSTLSLLHNCPVDEIKLDRSFVQAEPSGRPTMAAAVISLAQSLGLHAVAEGVETIGQAVTLSSLGYTAAQGHLFAPPMPPSDLDDILHSRRSLARQAGTAGDLAPAGLLGGGG